MTITARVSSELSVCKPRPWSQQQPETSALMGSPTTSTTSTDDSVIANSPVKHRQRRPQHWTHEEHERFLVGLDFFPNGPWRLIAGYVGTKTSRQVMAHAQKWRQKKLRKHKKQQLHASQARADAMDSTAGLTVHTSNETPTKTTVACAPRYDDSFQSLLASQLTTDSDLQLMNTLMQDSKSKPLHVEPPRPHVVPSDCKPLELWDDHELDQIMTELASIEKNAFTRDPETVRI